MSAFQVNIDPLIIRCLKLYFSLIEDIAKRSLVNNFLVFLPGSFPIPPLKTNISKKYLGRHTIFISIKSPF